MLLHWFVRRLARVTARVSGPWWLVAAVFGAVLGGLYLGRRTVGAVQREHGHADAGRAASCATARAALAGLALVKLAGRPSWSLDRGLSRRAGVPVGLSSRVAPRACARPRPSFLAIAGPGVLTRGAWRACWWR